MADMLAARQNAGEFIMAFVAVLSSLQWQLFLSSMADMLAAHQNAGELIMAVVAVLSLQQWQLFFSIMADMPAARQSASRRVHHCICGCSLRAAMTAVLQQHGRYTCCSSACCRRYNLWLFLSLQCITQQPVRYCS
jgi:hypothetical protein